MFDEDLARIRVHHTSMLRYQRLLKPRLSDLERQFVERRLSGLQAALEALVSEAFPVWFTLSKRYRRTLERGGVVMTHVLDSLIRGREKVIGHHRLLLTSAKTEMERELYRSRVEREQRLLDDLHDGFPDRLAA